MVSKKKVAVSLCLNRYLPVMCALVMLLHIVSTVHIISDSFAESVVMVCIGCMLFANDAAYGFCWVHRMMCCYVVWAVWCCHYQRCAGFGSLMPYMYIATVSTGFILFYFLFRMRCRKNC